jgi:DNA-binding Lrp family transcriptional regulator
MENKQKKTRSNSVSISEKVRKRIEASGERIWRLADFGNLSFTAVAQALSRLYRLGVIQRIGKGLYYRPRMTIFGQSKPNTSQMRSLPIQRKGVFPAGNAAANLLGFSTQNAAKVEVSTNALSLPRLLLGKKTIIHTRRPESWQKLSSKDTALLDFLRNHGTTTELSPEETVCKLLVHFREPRQFERLFRIALSEPPRVRAMLGAVGQELGYPEKKLSVLRKSLNSLSRFDFGSLVTLKYAKQWQAKGTQNS